MAYVVTSISTSISEFGPYHIKLALSFRVNVYKMQEISNRITGSVTMPYQIT